MRIIDNVNEILGDDLKTELRSDSKLRIAASTFSIFAFEALRKELEEVEELQFIFTSPTFVQSDVARQLDGTDHLPNDIDASSSSPTAETVSRRSTGRTSRSGCGTS